MKSNRNSKELRGSNTIRNFNLLAYGLTPFDAVARIGVLTTTATGAMFYDALAFMRTRIERAGGHVDPVYAKVLIAIEQVHRPDIPDLLQTPRRIEYLTGLLASINTDITWARGSTDPAVRCAMEAGFPKEMSRIAAVIDEAIGARESSGRSFLTSKSRRGAKPGPMQAR